MSSLAQPMVVYPQAITTQNASNSKGSFVPVFIVLAVIAVLAAIACIIGQVCARRHLGPRPRRDRAFYPKGDVESQPTARPAASGGDPGETRAMGNEGVRGEAFKYDATGRNKEAAHASASHGTGTPPGL